MLARRGEEIFAIGSTCSHYGGPLAEGLMVGETVRCPWHHARFSLRTGEAIGAPAFNPMPCWRVEARGGKAFVREKIDRRTESKAAGASATTRDPGRIVIVGGGAAGFAAAEMLRREGYTNSLTMLSSDDSPPYDRPCPRAWVSWQRGVTDGQNCGVRQETLRRPPAEIRPPGCGRRAVSGKEGPSGASHARHCSVFRPRESRASHPSPRLRDGEDKSHSDRQAKVVPANGAAIAIGVLVRCKGRTVRIDARRPVGGEGWSQRLIRRVHGPLGRQVPPLVSPRTEMRSARAMMASFRCFRARATAAGPGRLIPEREPGRASVPAGPKETRITAGWCWPGWGVPRGCDYVQRPGRVRGPYSPTGFDL
jgi:nitrite reductase/ring-hydroxylating ferredoxin subunit